MHADTPKCGFYRVRRDRNGGWKPIAIYQHQDGEFEALHDNDQLVDAAEIWSWACRNPITEELYRDVAENGNPWPDMDGTVAAQIGHNRGFADEADTLRDQIESAKAGADKYGTITDDDTEKAAQSLRSRLLELKGQAEKAHKVEKQPHLDGGRAVDAKWLPLAKDAEVTAKLIAAAIGAWEDAKELKRRETEMRKAAEAGAPPPLKPLVSAPAAPIKGAYGRAATVQVRKVVTITDQDAVYAAFKRRGEVGEFLTKLAQRAVDAGHEVPGIKVEEKRAIR